MNSDLPTATTFFNNTYPCLKRTLLILNSIFMERIVRGMFLPVLLAMSLIIILPGCDKKNDDNDIRETHFKVTNLVGSNNTYAGARVDANLVNGWGIAFSPTGNAWISSEDMGMSTVYNGSGEQVLAAVSIPSSTGTTGGHPTRSYI
jgi:hypothetical protein